MISNSQDGHVTADDGSKHGYTLTRGTSNTRLPSVTQTIKQYFQEFNQNCVINQMIRRGSISPRDVQKTINEWSVANTQGKMLHSAIENYLLGDVTAYHPDMHKFIQFWNSRGFTDKGYHVYPELRVYDMDIMISGTIDCLLTNDNGQFIIIDWKRCKNIHKTSTYNGKAPFNNLPDCNFSRYSLQLNFYRNIIANKYKINGITPSCVGMFLVIFPPDQPHCVVEKVDYINLDPIWYGEG